MNQKKNLSEICFPLEAINKIPAREKSYRYKRQNIGIWIAWRMP